MFPASSAARLDKTWPVLLIGWACLQGCDPLSARTPDGVLRLGCGGGKQASSEPHSEASTGPLSIAVDLTKRFQVIDGFGTTGSGEAAHQDWYGDLFYEELRASILRVDITPKFRAPYSDDAYNSPWFHNSPPLPGPDGNNVRTYRDASDYTREWNGQRARIAVLGPEIEKNIQLLDFDDPGLQHLGLLAQRGLREKAALGDFKLLGSLWSPAPWLKRSSGGQYGDSSDIMPKRGTPFPFIWGGNFAGGALDTSGKPVPAFDDRALGGTGATSALTQFARGLSAFLLGFQRKFAVPFHAISIQNELGFEVFYNSCAYRRTEDYVAALKAARAELDRHPELRSVQIIGPEDLLGEDGYSMWQFGAGEDSVPKNLKFMAAVAADPEAKQALAWFAVHGYALDGVHAANNQAGSWKLWSEGWQSAPGGDLPDHVKGARAYGKKSWMTEISGEPPRWTGDTEASMSDSALGIAIKIHNALTVGDQSAWLYWTLATDKPVDTFALTDEKAGKNAPKFVATKHYFHFIRPGARRVATELKGGTRGMYASAFLHEDKRQLIVVLINSGASERRVSVTGFEVGSKTQVEGFTSIADAPWRPVLPAPDASPQGSFSWDIPARSITTFTIPQG
jgi:O-glycosyl hydrolase